MLYFYKHWFYKFNFHLFQFQKIKNKKFQACEQYRARADLGGGSSGPVRPETLRKRDCVVLSTHTPVTSLLLRLIRPLCLIYCPVTSFNSFLSSQSERGRLRVRERACELHKNPAEFFLLQPHFWACSKLCFTQVPSGNLFYSSSSSLSCVCMMVSVEF